MKNQRIWQKFGNHEGIFVICTPSNFKLFCHIGPNTEVLSRSENVVEFCQVSVGNWGKSGNFLNKIHCSPGSHRP